RQSALRGGVVGGAPEVQHWCVEDDAGHAVGQRGVLQERRDDTGAHGEAEQYDVLRAVLRRVRHRIVEVMPLGGAEPIEPAGVPGCARTTDAADVPAGAGSRTPDPPGQRRPYRRFLRSVSLRGRPGPSWSVTAPPSNETTVRS